MEPQSSDELFEEKKLEEMEKLDEEYITTNLSTLKTVNSIIPSKNLANIINDIENDESFNDDDYTTTIPNDPLA